jgi:hypothetical protein
MPYTVTKRQGEPADLDDPPAGFRAVRTLDEARSAAYEQVVQAVNDSEHEAAPGDWLKDACCDLPAAGGIVGPLPDGTVIDVQHVTWPILYRLAGRPGVPGSLTVTEQETVDAYNALVRA